MLVLIHAARSSFRAVIVAGARRSFEELANSSIRRQTRRNRFQGYYYRFMFSVCLPLFHTATHCDEFPIIDNMMTLFKWFALGLPNSRARPKSAIFICPSLITRTLVPIMSQWATLFSWQYARPQRMCLGMLSVWATLSMACTRVAVWLSRCLWIRIPSTQAPHQSPLPDLDSWASQYFVYQALDWLGFPGRIHRESLMVYITIKFLDNQLCE